MPNQLIETSSLNTMQIKSSTRERIIAAATKLFIEKGYHGASTQDIAQLVQIRKSSLFHHFKNKDEIANATIMALLRQCREKIFDRIELHADTSKRARQFIEVLCTFQTEATANPLVSFIGTELAFPGSVFNEMIENYVNEWLKNLMKVLEPLHGNHKATHIAQSTLTYLHGANVMQRIYPDPLSAERFRHCLLELWQLKA